MSHKRRKRHNVQQVIAKLREADAMIAGGSSIGQVCQKLEVSEQTYHRWKQQYGDMKASEARRLKELETENARLKKLVADLALDKAILKEALDFLGND
jgi:transposase-like protein